MKPMNGDFYYGNHATGYEAKRRGTDIWRKEQAAIDAFVDDGPVLDVPIGTGRYIPIYKAKGLEYRGCDISQEMINETLRKYPESRCDIGSILELPYFNREFKTAVCTRLFHWLYPEDMDKAADELCRVADTVIVGVSLGPEGRPQNTRYIHDKEKFEACFTRRGMKVAGIRECSTQNRIYKWVRDESGIVG